MNLGFWEIALIGIILFILYGERFPQIMKKFGKLVASIKKIWEEEIFK